MSCDKECPGCKVCDDNESVCVIRLDLTNFSTFLFSYVVLMCFGAYINLESTANIFISFFTAFPLLLKTYKKHSCLHCGIEFK